MRVVQSDDEDKDDNSYCSTNRFHCTDVKQRASALFILEVRKQDGSVFPLASLHHITAGLMRHLRWNGRLQVDLFRDCDFHDFRASLDTGMKRLQREGIGAKKRQAEVLTEANEELMWSKGLLGNATPQSLLDTVVFYNRLFSALRSGKEHRQLRSSPCQVQVIERQGERPYLRYTEDISKNHPGGLKGNSITPKAVVHHTNSGDAQRCFVRIFQLYWQLCPKDVPSHAFYPKLSHCSTSTCWYSKIP